MSRARRVAGPRRVECCERVVCRITKRRSLLTAALGFARLETDAPEIRPLRRWLDTWAGLGAVAAGMARKGYDLQLTRYAEQGWRANVYPAGIAHSV